MFPQLAPPDLPTTQPDATRCGRHRARVSVPRLPSVRCLRTVEARVCGSLGLCRWFEDITRMSMALIVREVLGVFRVSLDEDVRRVKITQRETKWWRLCLTTVSAWRLFLRNT